MPVAVALLLPHQRSQLTLHDVFEARARERQGVEAGREETDVPRRDGELAAGGAHLRSVRWEAERARTGRALHPHDVAPTQLRHHGGARINPPEVDYGLCLPRRRRDVEKRQLGPTVPFRDDPTLAKLRGN